MTSDLKWCHAKVSGVAVVTSDLLPAEGRGQLRWNGHWVPFLDTMLQFTILGKDQRSLSLPTRLQRVAVDPQRHLTALNGNYTAADGNR